MHAAYAQFCLLILFFTGSHQSSLFDRPCWTLCRQCYTKKPCTYCIEKIWCAIHKVAAALHVLNMFVVFPSFLPTQTVKVFYELSGNLCLRQSGRVEVERQS